ncbi:hypothetical protein FF1_040953 [Malus domestica]
MKFSSTRDHDAADQHQPLLDKPAQERYEKIRQRCIKVLRSCYCGTDLPGNHIGPEGKTVNMLHNVHGVVMGSTPRETDVKRT